MYLKQIKVGPEGNFNYLIGPDDGGEAGVVDPSFDPERLMATARADGRDIVCILVTHTHGDHIAGLSEVVTRTKSQVIVHTLEMPRVLAALRGVERPLLRAVEEGDEINIGSLKGKVIHTPGHTPGGICYLFGRQLLTGDTLFVGGCGRCDLAGGDPRVLYYSLYNKLMKLPDDTQVLPGHDYGDLPVSTIGREKEKNPYLKWHSVEEFVQYRMVDYLKDKK